MGLNGALHEYAKALAPSEDQVGNYNQVVYRLDNILHQTPRVKFQMRPAGSFAKKSGIAGKMDLDIVLLINDRKPPFDDVLSSFQDTLLHSSDLQEDDIMKSPYSLQFSWPCGEEEVDVDLVMAANLVPNPSSVHDVCSEQHRRTLKEIKNYRNRKGQLDPFEGRRYYSGSFAESTIEFVREQSAPVHELIRLAKLWKNSIFFNRKVFGLSSTLEMIAIFVGMEMERNHRTNFSMMNAMKSFFQQMQNLSQANIVFSQEKMQQYGKGKSFYRSSDIPESVLNQRPLVLDPVDPYNNRLYGSNFNKDFFNLLSEKAKMSLDLLNRQSTCQVSDSELFSSVIKILFPGPFLLTSSPNLGRLSPISPPTNVAVDLERNERPKKLTLIKRRGSESQSRYADFCLKMYGQVMKSKKAFNARTTKTTESALHIVTKVVEHTTNKKIVPQGPLKENSYDFSLVIPCDEGALKIHFKW